MGEGVNVGMIGVGGCAFVKACVCERERCVPRDVSDLQLSDC